MAVDLTALARQYAQTRQAPPNLSDLAQRYAQSRLPSMREAATQAIAQAGAEFTQPATGFMSELQRLGAGLGLGPRVIEAALTRGRGFRKVLAEHGVPEAGPLGPAAVLSFFGAAAVDPATYLTGGLARLRAMNAPLTVRPAAVPVRASTAETSPAVQKVIQALKEAKPVRAEQEALYSAERGRRLAKALAIGERAPGEIGFKQQLGALGGELPRAEFEPIRGQIGQTDIDALFNQIELSPLLSGFAKINAKTGLAKLFGTYGTQVPIESELRLLGRVFGEDFVRAVTAKRGTLPRIMDAAAQLLGIPRTLMASFDLSAPFRQGVFLAPTHPRRFVQAFGQMFRYFGSRRAYRGLQESIVARPTFSLMERHGLALTGLDEAILTGREEAFMSNLAHRIPGLGQLVQASDRAYTGFLMKLRADVFDDLIRQAGGVEHTPALMDSIARFVNSATGRGDLGQLAIAGKAMSTALFSPRLLASRLNLLNPLYYASLEPFVRKQALKSLLGFTAAGMSVLGLARLAGAQVGIEPKSADFGKIRVGNTRLDIWGGFQQYPRIAAQMITGKYVSSTTGRELTLGEGYRPMTRKDIALRFFESKANPIVGFALDLLEGKDYTGAPISVGGELKKLFVPMVVQDIGELYAEDPRSIGLILPGIFGVGVQAYGPR